MKRKILIVEDDYSNTRMYYSLLNAYHYEVIDAREGLEGMIKAKDYKPDIIILDVFAPGMNLYEVTKAIKSDEELQNIPVICLISSAIEGDRKNAIDAGADGVIEKPVNPESFISQMESIAKSYKEYLK